MAKLSAATSKLSDFRAAYDHMVMQRPRGMISSLETSDSFKSAVARGNIANQHYVGTINLTERAPSSPNRGRQRLDHVEVSLDFSDLPEATLAKEIDLWKGFDYPAINRFVCSDADTYKHLGTLIITDRVDTDLQSVLDQIELAETREFSDTTMAMLALGCSAALCYVHKCGFVHRLIAPRHIKLDRQHHARLCGFSKAADLEEDELQLETVGVPLYVAPEMVLDKRRKPVLDEKVDMFSLGWVLSELLEGVKPRPSGPEGALLPAAPPDPEAYSTLGPRVRALLLRCLDPDPKKRISSEALFRELCDPTIWSAYDLNRAEYEAYRESLLTPLMRRAMGM